MKNPYLVRDARRKHCLEGCLYGRSPVFFLGEIHLGGKDINRDYGRV